MPTRSNSSPFPIESIERASDELAPGETSEATEAAIRASTLKRRSPKTVKRRRPPKLEIPAILEWAISHHARMGSWPNANSGGIPEAPAESWRKINLALRQGLRGLTGGSTLARLLFEQIGAQTRAALRPYTLDTICAWAIGWHARTGAWPNTCSGDIPEAPGETWCGVNAALDGGLRGLPGGSSLSRLLAERLDVENRFAIGTYTEERILAWTDAYHALYGRWPTSRSGLIPNSGGATWMSVHMALVQGVRGLPGASTLSRLLAQRRGVHYQFDLPHFSLREILVWVRSHRERNGDWPNRNSGPIPEAPGENWRKVDAALRVGNRGCPGGSSLPQFLATECGVRKGADTP